jgi:hypothetical protein
MSARSRFAVLVLAACLPWAVAAQSAKPVACPFKPEELSKTLGGSFKPGLEEPGLMGSACRYVGDRFNVGVLQTVLAGTPGIEAVRKMSNPGKTRFVPLAGDPDKAAVMMQAPDVPRFPALNYERGGLMVQVQIVGDFGGHPTDKAARDKAADAAVAKLATLRRLP